MPNDKGLSGRAEVAATTHMEDVDRYKVLPGEGATASQGAGCVSNASDVKGLLWMSELRDDARFTREMLDEAEMATQVQLCSSLQQRALATCKPWWTLRHHGASKASRQKTACEQSCDGRRIECKGRNGPSVRRAQDRWASSRLMCAPNDV